MFLEREYNVLTHGDTKKHYFRLKILTATTLLYWATNPWVTREEAENETVPWLKFKL